MTRTVLPAAGLAAAAPRPNASDIRVNLPTARQGVPGDDHCFDLGHASTKHAGFMKSRCSWKRRPMGKGLTPRTADVAGNPAAIHVR